MHRRQLQRQCTCRLYSGCRSSHAARPLHTSVSLRDEDSSRNPPKKPLFKSALSQAAYNDIKSLSQSKFQATQKADSSTSSPSSSQSAPKELIRKEVVRRSPTQTSSPSRRPSPRRNDDIASGLDMSEPRRFNRRNDNSDGSDRPSRPRGQRGGASGRGGRGGRPRSGRQPRRQSDQDGNDSSDQGLSNDMDLLDPRSRTTSALLMQESAKLFTNEEEAIIYSNISDLIDLYRTTRSDANKLEKEAKELGERKGGGGDNAEFLERRAQEVRASLDAGVGEALRALLRAEDEAGPRYEPGTGVAGNVAAPGGAVAADVADAPGTDMQSTASVPDPTAEAQFKGLPGIAPLGPGALASTVEEYLRKEVAERPRNKFEPTQTLAQRLIRGDFVKFQTGSEKYEVAKLADELAWDREAAAKGEAQEDKVGFETLSAAARKALVKRLVEGRYVDERDAQWKDEEHIRPAVKFLNAGKGYDRTKKDVFLEILREIASA